MTTALQLSLRTGGSELWLVEIDEEIYLASAYYVTPTAERSPPVQYEPLLLGFTAEELAFSGVGEGTELSLEPLRWIHAGTQGASLVGAGTGQKVRLRLGASEGLQISEFLDVATLTLDGVEPANRNRELRARLRSPIESLRRTGVARGRFLGLEWKLDLSSSVSFGANDARVTPSQTLYFSALVFMTQTTTSQVIVVRRNLSLAQKIVFRLVIRSDRTLRADIQEPDGTLRILLTSLVVPLQAWARIGFLWQDGTLRCLLDGRPSPESIPVAGMASTQEEITIGKVTSGPETFFITSFRYSLEPQELSCLEEKALRDLSSEESQELSLRVHYRFREGEGTEVFDETANEIDGSITVLGADPWQSSRTGSEELAEKPHPLVLGRRRRVPAIPLDAAGKWRKVSEGPIHGMTIYQRAEGEERVAWPKHSVTATGFLSTLVFTNTDPSVDVGAFAPGQSVRLLADLLSPFDETRTVRRARPDRIEFEGELFGFDPVFLAFDAEQPLTIKSTPPPPDAGVQITFGEGKLQGPAGLFRFRRAGQKLTVSSSGQNTGELTVTEDPRAPYDELRVAEKLVAESLTVTLTWQEHVEIATIDLAAGEFETLDLETVELVADVRGAVDPEAGWDPSPAGLVRALAARGPRELSEALELGIGKVIEAPAGSTSVGSLAGTSLEIWVRAPMTAATRGVALARIVGDPGIGGRPQDALHVVHRIVRAVGGNDFLYAEIDGLTPALIEDGDALEYEVFWPSDGPGQGQATIDLATSGGALREFPDAVDQNGIRAHPQGGDISGHATDQWYARRIPIPQALVGAQWLTCFVAAEHNVASSLEEAIVRGRIRNIRITDAAGGTRQTIWSSGDPLPEVSVALEASPGGSAHFEEIELEMRLRVDGRIAASAPGRGLDSDVLGPCITDGAWHRLRSVLDPQDLRLRLFVDGTEVGSAAVAPFQGSLADPRIVLGPGTWPVELKDLTAGSPGDPSILVSLLEADQAKGAIEAALGELRAEGWGEAGLYLPPEETFIGDALDQVLLPLDASWRFRLGSGAFDLALLRPPVPEPDEVIDDTELFELEPLDSHPGIEALTVTYGGDDASGDARQITAGVDLGKGREGLPRRASPLLRREDAERLGELLLANRSGNERSYRVAMPIYRYRESLIGSTWEITSRAAQGFEATRRVVCIGWSLDLESHRLTLTVWG